MSRANEIHLAVAEAYTDAVTRPSQGGCCSGSVQKGVAAKLAGYTREELEALPSEAVVNSFGCGNPLAFMDVKEGDVVLDLGSGAGIDILLAGKKVGPTGRAIGVDMTEAMVAKARENIAAAGLSATVEVRKGTIEELPVEGASVDWVISNCVINLSPDKPEVFGEIARVLKPGGRMRVSDIVAQGLPDWMRENASLHASCIGGAIGEDEYAEGLRRAGLVDVEVRERHVYDLNQMRGLIESELPSGDQSTCCGVEWISDRTFEEVAESLTGKVWSAIFYARKPR